MKLDQIIQEQGFIILDGALATELEVRGANLNHALWSAKLLKENPKLIKDVHLDYLISGANIIATASYQASFIGFEKQGYTKEEAIQLLKLSVQLAIEARKEFMSSQNCASLLSPLVAASLGPYGAALADGSEYTGYQNISIESLMDFHKERLAVIQETDADLIAFETIPCVDEAIAIKTLLADCPGKKAWISFSCKDEKHLCSGELFQDAIKVINNSKEIIGIGVNCTPPQYIEELIKIAQPITDKIIMAYPNKGEIYNPVIKVWEPLDGCANDFITDARLWLAAGAKAIGGCCRTGPLEIQQLGTLMSK
jgi:homocysteine S-methyltransferase